MEYQPTSHTVVFVSVFVVVYLLVLLKKAVRSTIDLYDLLILSSVAIVPAVFVFWPRLVVRVARLIGVEFAFLVLFAWLFLIVFIHLYGLVIRVNMLSARTALIIQEVALLRQELQEREGKVQKS